MKKRVNRLSGKLLRYRIKGVYIVVAFFVACYYYFALSTSPSAMDYEPKIEEALKKNISQNQPYIKDLELPAIGDSSYFVRNHVGRYSYMYSEQHVQSKWVAYVLTKDDVLSSNVKRSNHFNPDPTIIKNSWRHATKSDYYQSSFNRGHYVPSSDRLRDKEENRATFLFSNISPQFPRLNSGAWLYLEKKAKEWAAQYDKVYITMGALFDKKNNKYIGVNRLSIPTHLFKAVLMYTENGWQTAAFIMPNDETIRENYIKYIVTVNKLERLCGEDIFANLPDSIERKIEKRVNKKFWE